MEVRNAYEKIVQDSLQHVVCIDDDFIDLYVYMKETDEEKQKFTQNMYNNLKDRCDGHVELQRYYRDIDSITLDKCMRNKDLLVLDWELTGGNDKPVLEIIAQAVVWQIPFICIYTNRPDVENIYPVICDYFSGYTNLSVEEACDRWMDAGVFEEEFKADVRDLFAGSGRRLYELKKRFSHESEEIIKMLKDLDYDKKESWHPPSTVMGEKQEGKQRNPFSALPYFFHVNIQQKARHMPSSLTILFQYIIKISPGFSPANCRGEPREACKKQYQRGSFLPMLFS